MSHRTAPLQRPPTLTEVIEYQGDTLTVRSIVPANGGEQASTPADEVPPGVPGDETDALAASDGPAACASGQASPDELQLLLGSIEAEFEQQLRTALTPLFEQLLQQTVATARRSLAQLAAENGRPLRHAAEDASAAQSTQLPPHAREVSP